MRSWASSAPTAPARRRCWTSSPATAAPASGSITLAGDDVSALGPEARPHRGLTRTFQDARLYPGLTVLETVMAAADARSPGGAVSAMAASPWLRMSERDKRARAEAVLADFGLADRAGTLVGELSTGMRKVCDLAAVVAADPAVVLLDEPTAGLAQREAEALAPLLRDLHDRLGASVLVVEHDMPLMMSLCDRIYCLETGQVIAEGTPAEVRADAAGGGQLPRHRSGGGRSLRTGHAACRDRRPRPGPDGASRPAAGLARPSVALRADSSPGSPSSRWSGLLVASMALAARRRRGRRGGRLVGRARSPSRAPRPARRAGPLGTLGDGGLDAGDGEVGGTVGATGRGPSGSEPAARVPPSSASRRTAASPRTRSRSASCCRTRPA